jgi:hypothetical protein
LLDCLALDCHARTFWPKNEALVRREIDWVEAFNDDPQRARTGAAFHAKRKWHGADQHFLTFGHFRASLDWID